MTRKPPAIPWASVVPVAAILLFLGVNVVTGPGIPALVDGQPALVSHDVRHEVSWAVYRVNEVLLYAACAAGAVGIILPALLGAGRRGASPISPGADVRERFLTGSAGDWHWNFRLSAALIGDTLVVRQEPWLATRELTVDVPAGASPPIWFTRAARGWMISVGDGAGPATILRFYPRNPHRWFLAMVSRGFPVRPANLSAAQLPTRQPKIIASMGCALAFWGLVIGAVSLLFVPPAVNQLAHALGLS
jgi:hypothetical protein